jgi:hypothetical protein
LIAARAPWLALLLLGALSVASGCIAYDPDAEESATGDVGGPAVGPVLGSVEADDSASLALAEGGGAPTLAQGPSEAPPEAPPPPVIHQGDSNQGDSDTIERLLGELYADPSPDPWR